MKAQDLRIGNYLQAEGGNLNEVLEIRNNTLRCKYIRQDTNQPHVSIIDNSHLFGIPLTEEWLLKMGFEKKRNAGYSDSEDVYWDSQKMVLFIDGDGSINLGHEGGEYHDCEPVNDHQITSVHQLQNLYFALTGEELTIKKL